MKYRIYSNGKSYLLPEYKEMHSWGELITINKYEEKAIKLEDGDTLYLTIDDDLDGDGLNCIYFSTESGEVVNLFYYSVSSHSFIQSSTNGYICSNIIGLYAEEEFIRVYKYDGDFYDIDQNFLSDEAKLKASGATCVLMLKLEIGPTNGETTTWRLIHPESVKRIGQTIELPSLEDKITISPMSAVGGSLGWFYTLESGEPGIAYYFHDGIQNNDFDIYSWQQSGQGWFGNALYDFQYHAGPTLWIYHLGGTALYDFIDENSNKFENDSWESIIGHPEVFADNFPAEPTILWYNPETLKWELIQEGNRYGYDY